MIYFTKFNRSIFYLLTQGYTIQQPVNGMVKLSLLLMEVHNEGAWSRKSVCSLLSIGGKTFNVVILEIG